jgi:hypothetical protein
MSTISLLTREEFLEQLSSYPVDACAIVDGDTTSCAICTRDLVDEPADDSEECAVLLHDTHAFGEECVREWLASNTSCPCCRSVLFQEPADENDDAGATIGVAVPIETTFDEEELAHLLWWAGQVSERDPKTEAFSDQELMSLYWALWNQWMTAYEEDEEGTWELGSPRSTEVGKALHQLLMVRYDWWCHSPQQLDLQITGNFEYLAGNGVLSERDLNRNVTIDFDCDLQSEFRLRELMPVFSLSFDEDSSCQTAAGHPEVAVLFDRLDGALQNYAGRKMKAWQLKRKLQKCIGKPDELKRVVRDLPQGYAEFVRYLVDETTRTAITRTKENKRALRALRDRMLSGAPRMSAPSTMSRRG